LLGRAGSLDLARGIISTTLATANLIPRNLHATVMGLVLRGVQGVDGKAFLAEAHVDGPARKGLSEGFCNLPDYMDCMAPVYARSCTI